MFPVLSHDMYMLLMSICLASVPCGITSYVSLYIMYLNMLISYVVLRTYDYDHVPKHAYVSYVLMLVFMSHYGMTSTLYYSSQHHLTSLLFQLDLAGCGFRNFMDPLQMEFIGD